MLRVEQLRRAPLQLDRLGPVDSQPERNVSATAEISSSSTAGGWKPRRVVLGTERRVHRLGFEADEALGLVGPRHSLLGRVADREDRAGAIGAAAKLAEHVPRPPVEADPAHAFDRKCLVEASNRTQLSGRRDEEADARAADPCVRRELVPADLFAERRRDGEAVEVDAERNATELRIVPPAQARGELADDGAVVRDDDLRIRRPLGDAERRGRPACRVDRLRDPLGRLCGRPRVRERDPESRRVSTRRSVTVSA